MQILLLHCPLLEHESPSSKDVNDIGSEDGKEEGSSVITGDSVGLNVVGKEEGENDKVGVLVGGKEIVGLALGDFDVVGCVVGVAVGLCPQPASSGQSSQRSSTSMRNCPPAGFDDLKPDMHLH